MSEEARSVVRALAARYPTAIVSGRARATAQGLVQLDELYYACSHGFDIEAQCLLPLLCNARDKVVLVTSPALRRAHAVGRAYLRLLWTAPRDDADSPGALPLPDLPRAPVPRHYWAPVISEIRVALLVSYWPLAFGVQTFTSIFARVRGPGAAYKTQGSR